MIVQALKLQLEVLETRLHELIHVILIGRLLESLMHFGMLWVLSHLYILR